jgi:hypothetical protein
MNLLNNPKSINAIARSRLSLTAILLGFKSKVNQCFMCIVYWEASRSNMVQSNSRSDETMEVG